MAIISAIVVILATAAIVGDYDVQTAKAQKNFGKVVSEIAKNDPHSLGPNDENDFCDDNCNDGVGKAFGKAVSERASKNK